MEQQDAGFLHIKSENDIVSCRKLIRDLTTQLGFGVTDVTRIVTSVSELARNVFIHAKQGEMHWKLMQKVGSIGIELVFIDQGPGIADIGLAMQPGFTTTNTMGMGLPGVKRLMDEMQIDSAIGTGTTVTVTKWAKARR